MDKICIIDLEVFFQVGVGDEERSRPQRLLVSLEMEHDFAAAVSRDNLADTVDYHAVCQRVLTFGEGCHWHLIETLAADIASMVLEEFKPRSVLVDVKKFVIPQAAHVSVSVRR
jgi:dihydroneopterin aldolase